MGTEIERKFLIDVDKLREWSNPKGENAVCEIKQAYVYSDNDMSIRVRLVKIEPGGDFDYAELGTKIGNGPIREEFEHEINLKLANELYEKHPSVQKVRYTFFIPNSERYWEVDKFLGHNEGLWIAEIELGSLDEPVNLPDWIGEEVTWNAEYYNCNLVK